MNKSVELIIERINTLSNFLHTPGTIKSIDNLDFEGFGGISKYLLDEHSDEYTGIKNALISLDLKTYDVDHVINSMTNSILSSFFTPEELIKNHVLSLKQLSENNNLEVKSILEPSAGNGKYIKHLREAFPNATIYALEKETLTGAFLKYNYFDDDKVVTSNTAFEKIGTTNFPETFDLIVSNVPFGDFGVFDPKLPIQHTKQIHNYFFLKALELSHPNTITSFITSKGFLDAQKNQDIRLYIEKNANFLGAFRLPNHTFKNANTSVVADLVYLQKGDKKQHQSISFPNFIYNTHDIFLNTEHKDKLENYINEYFTKNDNILGTAIPGGMYRKDDFTIKSDKSIEEFSEFILSASNNFDVLNYSFEQNNNLNIDISEPKIELPILEIKNDTETIIPKIIIPEDEINEKYKHLKIGNIYIGENSKTFLIENIGENLELSHIPFPKTIDVNRISSIVELRDLYNKLLLIDAATPEFDKNLAEFNSVYDLFVFQYQELNFEINQRIISFDSQHNEILDFEKLDDKNKYFIKNNIFYKEHYITEVKQDINLKNIDHQQAILLSLNKTNTVDIDYVSNLLKVSNEQFITAAVEKNILFLNPLFDNNYNYTGDFEYTSKELFYSGHIDAKINFYKNQELNLINPAFQRNYLENVIAELEDIKPQIIPFEQLNAKIGEGWIDIKTVRDFVKETYKVDFNIRYNKSLDKYFVEKYQDMYFSSNIADVKQEFSFTGANGRRYMFEHILEANLNSQIPTINRTISQKPLIKVIDKPSVLNFENKMKRIDNDFTHYILNNQDLKKGLEYKYHHKFNSILKPTLSSKHLTFDNLTFDPYEVQLDAAMQIIQNNGGIVDHKVGWGKTITAAMIAMKMKEMGIVKKSMLLALPSTITDIEKNIKSAYPKINILTARDKDFIPINRDNFVTQIKSKDWDLVLISHTNYNLITQNLETQQEIINEQLDNIDRDLEALDLKYDDVSSQMRKGLIKRKNNLEVKLLNLNHKFNTKAITKYTFDQLGIDHLFVDESHSFKNLAYSTRHDRVAGLNNADGSDKSHFLLTGIRTLQKKYNADKGVTFLSGTTLSNSITELYVLFKYLIPKKLENLNIKSFDQWVKVFGEKSLDVEKGMSGNYIMKERFRHFKKVPELSALYTQIAHVSHHSPHIKTPSLNNNFETLNPYPVQKEYFKDLEAFAATSNVELLNDPTKEYSDSQLKATALIAMNYMIKASLDLRIINAVDFDDDENNRVRKCAKNIYDNYIKSNDFKGTQLVFSDRSTPKADFNIYRELKRVLVEEYDIPKGEVTFIHNHDTNQKKKDKFIKNLNSGDIRIAIGSTSKLGTGLNIQERGVAIHHFDIPYKPSEFEQRIGRFVRKGNIFAESHFDNIVQNYLYATIGSIDVKLFDLNNIKNNFIN